MKIRRWSFDHFLSLCNSIIMRKYQFFNPKYIIYLLLLNLCCIVIGYALSYIDNVNMINNGYVNSNSISFTTKKPPSHPLVDQDNYILFQSNPESPNFKHVILSGSVLLPPIDFFEKYDLFANKKKVAIIGEDVPVKYVPTDYKIIGTFDYSNSYKLNKDIWLISSENRIDKENGNFFTFSSPERDVYKVLKKNFKENSIQKINLDVYGTYSLNSNQTVVSALKIGLLFINLIFIFASFNWMIKDKYILRILYLSGENIYSIFFSILKYKLAPYILLTLSFVILDFLFHKFIRIFWSDVWLTIIRYLIVGFNLYLIGFSLILIIYFTLGKGGKRF